MQQPSKIGTIPSSTTTVKMSTNSSQHRYEAPWNVYAMNWSCRREQDKQYRLAVGSLNEGHRNQVQIVQLKTNETTGVEEFNVLSSFEHLHPATKIVWIPDIAGHYKDLVATSGDCIRLWDLGNGEKNSVRLECLLSHKDSTYGLPVTSFDWNDTDPTLLVTASIDRTCTLWSLEGGKAVSKVGDNSVSGSIKQQVLAHDGVVYDVAFSPAGGGRDIITSVSADGSLRLFDLRQPGNTTIIYEDADRQALVRHAWNRQNGFHLAVIAQDSCEVVVLDVRFPERPLCLLKAHTGCVNALAWAPHDANFIATAGDDQQTLAWDLKLGGQLKEATCACPANGPVNNLQWANVHPEWIAICYHSCLEILKL